MSMLILCIIICGLVIIAKQSFFCGSILVGEGTNMPWKDEIKLIIENGYSDSDIEDFVDTHPDVNGKDIWDYVYDYVYDYVAPAECKGCKHVQMSGTMPCIMCSRRVKVKDFYESR